MTPSAESQSPRRSSRHLLSQFKETVLFFSGAVSRYREVGMPLPCSQSVADRLAELLPRSGMRRIVEIGAGTGRISRSVLERTDQNTEVVCVEKDAAFCDYLQQAMPTTRARILNVAAENLIDGGFLQPASADCVILSLAPRLAPDALRLQWVDVCAKLLHENGTLIIHQVIPTLGRYFNKSQWETVSRRWFVNFPPFRVDFLQKAKAITNGPSRAV
jgi:phospholipid N-methyltransferase